MNLKYSLRKENIITSTNQVLNFRKKYLEYNTVLKFSIFSLFDEKYDIEIVKIDFIISSINCRILINLLILVIDVYF